MKQVILLILLLPLIADAQDTTIKSAKINSHPWSFTSSVAGGAISGERGTRAVFQLGTGIKYRWLYAGLGAGYDPYVYESFPVFAELKIEDPESRSLFAYGQAGYSIHKSGSGQGVFFWPATKSTTHGGLYIDLGIGCRVLRLKSHALAVSLGYSMKKASESVKMSGPCGFAGCDATESKYTTRYKFGRLIAKIVVEIGW